MFQSIKIFQPNISVPAIQTQCKTCVDGYSCNQPLKDTVSFTGVKEKEQLQDKAEIKEVLERVRKYYHSSQRENRDNFDNELQNLCKIQDRNKNNPSFVLDSISQYISDMAKNPKKTSLTLFALGLAFVKNEKDANKYVNDYADYIRMSRQSRNDVISQNEAKLIAFQNLYAISTGYISGHDYKKFNDLFNEEKQQRLFGKAYDEHIEIMLKYGGVYKNEYGGYSVEKPKKGHR